jgi:GTP-binding protein
MGRQCAGPDGEDLILRVPPGTQVVDDVSGRLLAELTEHNERVVILAGGKGGMGNMNFKSSVNQAPRRTTPGYPGEFGTYRLVLKTIADIGLVGYPNAGKSTLTNAFTAARPKMAPYPFTTLHVNVGVIEYPETFGRIFMADIPGLIEGAHENRGLGHQFLRHIERCTLLVFILDMAGSENRKPWDDFRILERELALYSPILAAKPRLVVANKMDLPEAAANLAKFRDKVPVLVAPISCYSREGFDELKATLWKFVKGSPEERTLLQPTPVKVKAVKAKAVAPAIKPAAKPLAKKIAKAVPAKKAKPVVKIVTKPIAKKDVKKVAAKQPAKPVAKKSPVKKPVAKKPVAKKPAAKRLLKPVGKKKAAPVKKAAIKTKAKKK